MSNRININYGEVVAMVAELKERLGGELSTLESQYANVKQSIQDVDGATNGQLFGTLEANLEKARTSVEMLVKLLMFIKAASDQVEVQEMAIAMSMKDGTTISSH